MKRILSFFVADILQPPDWQDILTYFRGSELQNFFTKILEDNLKAIIKPQYVDHIPKAVKGTVNKILDQKDDLKIKEAMVQRLDLGKVCCDPAVTAYPFCRYFNYYIPHNQTIL